MIELVIKTPKYNDIIFTDSVSISYEVKDTEGIFNRVVFEIDNQVIEKFERTNLFQVFLPKGAHSITCYVKNKLNKEISTTRQVISFTTEPITIDLKKIIEPSTDNHLVIEGAGGILVPLNDNDCIIDLIQSDYKVILVSRHYLGSINHTLLTFEALKNRNIAVAGIVFSGDENKASEEIILSKTKAKFIGRIENEPYFDQNVIQYYADKFRDSLLAL